MELFTSQGCSSCPPADQLLGEYAERNDVLALSFRSTTGTISAGRTRWPATTTPSASAPTPQARGDGQVYTPQVVVNGSEHVVGSNRAAIEAALQQRDRRLAGADRPHADDDAITVNIGAAAGATPPTAARSGWSCTTVGHRADRARREHRQDGHLQQRRPQAPADRHVEGRADVGRPAAERDDQAKVARCAVLLQTGEATAACPARSSAPPDLLRALSGSIARARPRVAIFVKEPDIPLTVDQTAVADGFRMPRRESEVAALLATGRDLARIAAELGLSLATVGNHLKRLLDKMGAHS